MSEALRQQVEHLYAAYARGDVDAVVACFHPEVRYISYVPTGVFPHPDPKTGLDPIRATMTQVHAVYEFSDSRPTVTVTADDAAAVLVHSRLRERASGRTSELVLAHFLRFRDGRIIEVREVMNSFEAVQEITAAMRSRGEG